jgi:hypothetical protein
MKPIRSLLLAIVALFVTALAAAANLSWTVPTTYTDGEALPASQIAFYTINYAPATGQAGPAGTLKVSPPATTATVPVLCGSTSFTISVTTTASATYPNASSAQSSAVPYVTSITCTPNTPTGLTVTGPG